MHTVTSRYPSYITLDVARTKNNNKQTYISAITDAILTEIISDIWSDGITRNAFGDTVATVVVVIC